MTQSNLMRLKDGWCIEDYTLLTVSLYNEKTGLSKTVLIPPLFQSLLKKERDAEGNAVRSEMRRLISAKEDEP